jgi:hypothetical protein
MEASEDNETGFNPRRRLCPDGSCIGIIGSDGRCTECGCAAPAGEVTADSPAGAADQAQDSDFDDVLVADVEPGDGPSDDASGFDPRRRLCGDDTCIGVIGADNRCTECGKPADG